MTSGPFKPPLPAWLIKLNEARRLWEEFIKDKKDREHD